MVNRVTKLLLVTLALTALVAVCPAIAQEGGKAIVLKLGKVEEAEAQGKLQDPNYGYIGQLGSFVATKDSHAKGMIVVHSYPDTTKMALGCTKLVYEGAKRLGEVDGYVFKTEWDGKVYPSKIFFSAQKVYFGGGINDYIAADYRDGSGWVWKLHPLRRLKVTKTDGAAAASVK